LTTDPAPQIDGRTAADVAQQLQQLLALYSPWNEIDLATGAASGVSAGLIGVTARFAEVLIQRLNQVPQKNFLAYLNLLGAALRPPQPARVPVTFLLAQGSLIDTLVPGGTQVAAPPGAGETDPVVYETEHEMIATSAQLMRVLVRDPDEDTYAEYSDITAGRPGTSVFHGNQPIAHTFYLGRSQFLDSQAIVKLNLIVDLKSPAGDDIALKWEIWTGATWTDITPHPADDGTRNLRQSGTIQFGRVPAGQATSVAGTLTMWMRCRLVTPITSGSTVRRGMVRAAQLPIIRSIDMQIHLHNEGLPIDEAYSSAIGLIDLSKDFYPFGEKPKFNDTLWLALEEAFANAGATVKLSIAVSNPPGSSVQFPPPAAPSEDLQLRWEVWNGKWVELGTSDKNGPVATNVDGRMFSDTTKALSQNGAVAFVLPPRVSRFSVNGKESFWVRVRIISGNYGLEGHFEAGSPGAAPNFIFKLPTFRPPSIRSLRAMYDLDDPTPPQTQVLPDIIIAENDFAQTDVTALNNASNGAFVPFQPSEDTRPTCHLGFILPAGRTSFPNTTITMFFRAADLQYGEKTVPLWPDVSRAAADPGNNVSHAFVVTNGGTDEIVYALNVLGVHWTTSVTVTRSDGSSGGTSPASIALSSGDWAELDIQVAVPAGTLFGASDPGILQFVSPDQVLYSAEFVTFCHAQPEQGQQLQLTWEYWNGESWAALVVSDETNNLTGSGTIEFLAPPDFAPHAEFGGNAWWLRVRWDGGHYDTDPRIDRVLLNTTMAAQTVTVSGETLGSSDGSANQLFRTTRTPVLVGQRLTVREPEMPSGDELNMLRDVSGPDAVVAVPVGADKAAEIWVTWQEVTDFYASDTRSRHYVLDHVTGEISFGDGQNGMVPPLGPANIRLASYQTGGGARGNRPSGSIVQLKTTVPYIDKVMNAVEASGGADAESIAELTARAPLEIRHRHRAVTSEDYEDLAHLASADVTRALCVPNRDLAADPLDQTPPVLGNVSLIIVPNSADSMPRPSVELVRRVQQFIADSCPVTASVKVVGPLYVRADVQTEIGLASLDDAGTVAAKVQNALAGFLHPLTGGPEGNGWAFGREPHRSDIYAVIERIPEVDHVRALTVEITESLPGSRGTGRFLVYSGNHEINLVFEP
jgi:hypothetical protein